MKLLALRGDFDALTLDFFSNAVTVEVGGYRLNRETDMIQQTG